MENIVCSFCNQALSASTKFCTNCGAKVIVGPNAIPNAMYHICECGAKLKPETKFCASCGKMSQHIVESSEIKKIKCDCGTEINVDSKFCSKCGKMTEQTISKSDTYICLCGAELSPNAKFCRNCGRSTEISPVSTIVTGKKPYWRRKRILATVAISMILFGAAYFIFIYNPGIKKTLLSSYEILPNDSTETVIAYQDELTISIPPGVIKERDSLHLYSVENIDAPEFADGVLRTYDIDFENNNTFNNEIEVVFSYKNDMASNNLSSEQSVHVMYYNEETEGWENSDALIDKRTNSIRVFRSHFSCLGLVSHSSTPNPMMQVYAMIDPASVDYVPEYSDAQDVVKKYSEQKNPDKEAIKAGVDFFLTSYDITSLATDIHQQIFNFERFSKFNKLGEQVTIIRAAISLGIELGQERYLDAIVNVTKTAISLGAAAAGFKFVVIYNVAVFLYDLYSDRLDAEELDTEMKNYMADYYHYNANVNPFRKSIKEWAKYINDNIEKSVDFEWQLQQEVKKYVEAYFEVKTDIPQNIKESIMKHESIRMRDVIKEAMILYVKEVKDKQERDMIQYLFDMKKEINSVITIQVNVYGSKEGSKAVRNLPVKIVVNKEQELWSGQTDHAGQFTFNCTWLGYLTYGCPQNVEVVYDDVPYYGKINIDKSNMAVVRIYIKEESDDEEPTPTEDVFSFSSIAGTYVAYCKDYKSYFKDQNGQFVENTGSNEDEYKDYYLELVVSENGSATINITSSGYCNPLKSGKTQFMLNKFNVPEASAILEYTDDCPPVDDATQKMHKMLQNGSYTAKIQYEEGLMKVQYTAIINFGVDLKEVLFFDGVKK